MNELVEKYVGLLDEEAYYIGKDGKPWAHSAHGCSKVRYDKAKEQVTKEKVSRDKIIEMVTSFLEKAKIKTTTEPVYNPQQINYAEIKKQFGLESESDLVWMKFTEDGYLGVVAASNDINFDFPESEKEYTQRKENGWKRNTSGILVHSVGKKWNKKFVLVFPLANIPDGYTKFEIEEAIGNLLLANNIPIIDYYSHVY